MAATEAYAPLPMPLDPAQLPRAADYEFQQLQAVVNSKADRTNIMSWVPVKGIAGRIEGTGVTDPVLRADAYNVLGVTRQGVGLYRWQIDQTTIMGRSITDLGYPFLSAVATGTPSVTQYVVGGFVPGAPAGFVDTQVSEFYITGVNLRVQPYDLQAGEYLWFMYLINLVGDNAETVPAIMAREKL